jgi:hypothetical protein
MRHFLIIAGVSLGITLFAVPSDAQRNEPKKANKFQSTLVTSYELCAVPNDATGGGLALPACSPAVATDTQCTLGPRSVGKLLGKVSKFGDILLNAKLTDIQNCEGESLCAVASLQATTNNCVSNDPGGCTTIAIPDLPFPDPACCVVNKRKCKIKTTVNTAIPGVLNSGDLTSITLSGCGLGRTTGTAAGIVARCGVLVP